MPEGPFFEQYQHIPRVRKLTEGLSSTQRSALLETTPLFTNGYTSSPFVCSRADIQILGGPRGYNDLTIALTKSFKARPFCFSCGKIAESAETLKNCSRCRTAQYCSVSCQKKDWKLSAGGGQHRLICDDLYEDLMARQVTGEAVRTVVAEGSLNDIGGRFVSEEAERFNEKFGTWREFGRQIMHLIASACLEKGSKFNIDPVTTLELTSTRFLLEEVPGRQQNEDMFRIIYMDQVSSDIFVSRARTQSGPYIAMNDRIDIFQHAVACTRKTNSATTSDVLEAQAPGVGVHAVQFFFAGKPLIYSSTMRYDISKIIGCHMYPFPDPVLTFDKLIGVCNRGTMTLLKTHPKLLAIKNYKTS